MRGTCVLALLVASLRLLAADNDLPKQSGAPQTGRESELFKNDGRDPLFPNTKLTDSEFLLRTDVPSVGRAQTEYEQAQRKEVRWQKLVKSGVLAQVEVERATLQTARARVRFERARVAQQESELNDLRTRSAAGSAPADAVAAAESALTTARTMADEADTSLRRTELLLAEANVDRQRRLLKMGAGSRSQLQRAESALAQLRAASATVPPPP